jgi:NAD(P)-dependent dehydrogenase (short-subunit alcohol dehydrogenase family)
MKFKHKVLLASAATGAFLFLNEKRAERNARSISGAVVVITGGSRGLGLALAREFAAEGCRIAICARDEKELDEAREDLRKHSARVFAFVCDVAEKEQVEAFAAAVTSHFGRIDIWVNNAAIIQVAPLEDLKLEDFEKAMAVNFWGKVHGAMAVLPQMLERRSGHIVNINSVGGMISLPHMATYSVSKFAGQGYSESLSVELAPKGVQVTTVSPGPIRTGSFTETEYSGDASEEMEWFGAQASFPLPAPLGPLAADKAASLIVRAVKRGTRHLVIPPIPMDIIARAHGLLPELSLAVRTWINGHLPAPTGDDETKKGEEVLPEVQNSLAEKQMEAGKTQGANFNQ